MFLNPWNGSLYSLLLLLLNPRNGSQLLLWLLSLQHGSHLSSLLLPTEQYVLVDDAITVRSAFSGSACSTYSLSVIVLIWFYPESVWILCKPFTSGWMNQQGAIRAQSYHRERTIGPTFWSCMHRFVRACTLNKWRSRLQRFISDYPWWKTQWDIHWIAAG